LNREILKFIPPTTTRKPASIQDHRSRFESLWEESGSKQVREIIAAVAQSQLVAFQFYRVLGVTFLVLYAAGQLPGIFALPAGWGDVMVGLTALMVGARAARSENDQLVTLWNWLGISDLVIAVATGFLSG
jgi:hypothetical protein